MSPMPVPVSNTGYPVRFLFAADCYGQPLRIQYVDGALWFVQTDLQAVLRMRLRAPLETVPDADGLWKFERLAGVEEALLDERGLAAILGYAQGLPAVSRFAIWLSAQLPRQVRAAMAEHRAGASSQPTLPAVTTPSPVAPLSIADTAIRRDADGRFCLNDLHKAAGGKRTDQPSNFLRSDEAQRLIAALIAEDADPQNRGSEPVQSLKGGDGPQGTYVVKELVYAYAMWVSPTFHLRVIRAFDALVSGQTLATAPVSILATRRPGDPVELDALSSAEMFLALQLTFSNNPAAAKLMWALVRFGAHRVPLRMNARELHRRIGGMIERTNINTTARKLHERGLVEFSPGRYRVLETALVLELVAALDAAACGLGALLAQAISASADMALPEPEAGEVRRLH